mgnify:CR=1 FL=1
MAKLAIKKASTDVTTYVFIQDSSKTTGEGLAGLAYNTGSLVGYYVRPKGSATAITLATQTVTGDHSDGGFVEIDATNMPGVYRLDLPDAVCATGVPSVVVMLKGATDMSPVVLEIQLTDFDLNTAAITAAAVADAVWDEATADHTTASSFGALDANVDAILADTGTDGVVLKAAGLNADAVTKIQSGLALEATLTAIKGAGWNNGTLQNIKNDTDSQQTALQEIKGEGWTDETLTALMTAIEAVTGGSGATAQEVWEYTTRVLTAGTNIDLSALATAADLATLDGKVDTVDGILDDLHDTDIPAIKADTAAIKAKTDNIPASPAAVGSAMTLTAAYDKAKDDVLTPLAVVDSIVDGLKTTLDNVHDTDLPAVKTETAAIKAKTDNLPATPASAGEYTTNIGAIKAKTDNLPATPAASGEYTSALSAIQNDLDNPDQYKADVSGIPAAVWGYATRTLSSFGSLIADIWSHVTRTLSSFGFTVATNSDANVTAIKAKTDNLPANTATALAAIQSDLDNPAQYKADVSGLATTAHVQEVENKIDAIDVTVNTIPTNPLLDTAYTAPDNAGIAAILEDTDTTLPATLAGLATSAEVGAITMLDEVVVGSYTMQDILKILAAKMVGKATGGSTATITYRGVDDTSDVIIETVDSNGNRSAVTLTV